MEYYALAHKLSRVMSQDGTLLNIALFSLFLLNHHNKTVLRQVKVSDHKSADHHSN
jgi:hypothetical protein